MKSFNTILSIFLIIVTNQLYSQQRIPFIYKENKRVYVEVNVNDSTEKLLFFFDTGATSPMIDLKVAQKLGIQPTLQETFSGASGEKIFQLAEGQSLTFSDKVKLENLDFIMDDMSRLNESTGLNFDGIIGYELLNSFVTVMDFDKKEFILFNDISQVDLKEYVPHPFTWTEEIPIPHYPLTIKLDNNKSYSGIVLFDSGAGLGLLINTKFQQEHDLMSQFNKKIIGSSNDLTGKGQVLVSTIASMKFLDYTFEQRMNTHIASDESGVSAMPGYLGILGAEIINRFNYVFDYKNMTIYAKPNESFVIPFKTDFAPLGLILKNNEIEINHIVPDTNAAKARIEVGDIILTLNNKKPADIFEARELLLQTGKKVKLKLKKANNTIEVKEILIQEIL